MSKSRLENGVPVDLPTGSAVTIDHVHSEIHSGSHYTAEYTDELGAAGTLDLLFVTPAAGTMHVVFEASVESAATVEVYKGVTTSDDGTAVSAVNSNDLSSNTATMVVTHTPTVTDTGTLVRDYPLSGSGNSPDFRRESEERVLARDTKYLVRVTSAGGSNICHARGTWYEE